MPSFICSNLTTIHNLLIIAVSLRFDSRGNLTFHSLRVLNAQRFATRIVYATIVPRAISQAPPSHMGYCEAHYDILRTWRAALSSILFVAALT